MTTTRTTEKDLNDSFDSLAETAMRIASERNELMRLVKSALRNQPRDYVAWRVWIDEAHGVLRSIATPVGDSDGTGKAR